MILATNNKGKLKELKKIFTGSEIISLSERGITIDVLENEDSFLGNATKKAKEIYAISGEPTIADDSGLCIDCLDDFPGVMTHRFLGEDATDRMRNEYLISRVNEYNEQNKDADRSAKFICTLVYYDGKRTLVGNGILNGKISTECRGKNGFGFDEIFVLPNGKTLAELSTQEKEKYSPRTMAAKVLVKKINK